MNERQAKFAEMREFLWDHWHHRKCGTLLFTAVSKEGKTSHSEFRVALIPPSTMILKIAVIRDRIGAESQVIPRTDPNGDFEAYTVERIVTTDLVLDSKAKATVLRDEEAMPASKYLLRLKGWQRDQVTYF